MRDAFRMGVLLSSITVALAAEPLQEKYQKKIEAADIEYQEAVQEAANAKHYAVQEANQEYLDALQLLRTDAMKAGDFDTASAMNERITAFDNERSRTRPAGTVTFGGHEYAVIKTKLSWYQAKRRCEDLGGHLVTFESREEQDFVLTLCRKEKVDAWLGLTNENDFKWTWISGAVAQPDASWKIDDPQREFFSGAMTYWVSTDSFNDHNLGAFIGFICEWEKPQAASQP